MTGKPPVFSPHRDESTSAAPGISPGIVEDGELILREMYIPHHVTEDGKLARAVIQLKELQETGVSGHRRQHTTAAQVSETIKRRLKLRQREGKDPWKSAGVSVLGVGQIRKMRTQDNEKAFVVTDDGAKSDNKSHASIYAVRSDLLPSKLRELRLMLLPMLEENLMPVKRAFESRPPPS